MPFVPDTFLFAQIDHGRQVRRVGQHGRELAIVALQELFEHQTGEQLRLRELLGTRAVAIIRQARPARPMRDEQHPPRRLRGLHITIVTDRPTLAGKKSQAFSTEHSRPL